MRWALGAPVLALALAVPAGRAAADEGESALSLSLGYASAAIPEHEPEGGALGLEYERGIGGPLWLRAAAAGAAYAEAGDASYGGQATIGLTYVVDVLRYVPYLEASVGGAVLGGGALDTEAHPVAELGLGLDLLSRRGLSYGLFAKVASFLDDSEFVAVGARLSWRWGFF